MKPTQEQVIAWAREICGPTMMEWRDGTEMEWHEFHALALRCYEEGRKDENEACAKVCDDEEARIDSLHDRLTEDLDRPIDSLMGKSAAARRIAAAIRARGQV